MADVDTDGTPELPLGILEVTVPVLIDPEDNVPIELPFVLVDGSEGCAVDGVVGCVGGGVVVGIKDV